MKIETCPTCKGRGFVLAVRLVEEGDVAVKRQFQDVCPTCDGVGTIEQMTKGHSGMLQGLDDGIITHDTRVK
jgi:DnaJ-class molecular chaperone